MIYNGKEENYKIEKIRIYIRVRPLLKYEDEIFWQINKEKNIIYTNNYYSYDNSEDDNDNDQDYLNSQGKNEITNLIYSPQKFFFEKIYTPNTESQIIYKEVCQDIVKNTIEGFNGCILIYGQTTSGKTFTMLGSPNNPGILPCTLNDIFISINKKKEFSENIIYNIYCSYIEIYNEKINDLLNNSSNLRLIEDKKYGIIVSGAKRVKIKNFEEGLAIKDFGEEKRKYRETLINEYSSRSHCIFQIYIEQIHLDEEGNTIKSYFSCLNLVDLAGSERINKKDTKFKNMEETGYINKSLFMLTNVINKLAENSSSFNKNVYIPYRDSILTRLLSQSLGGNSLTTIICTISPAQMNYYQTLSTLRFASRAKSIKLEIKTNEYFDNNYKMNYYQKEIKKLKEQLNNKNDILYNNINYEEATHSVSKYEYNKLVNANKYLNEELKNYKNLYLKEKEKSAKYKETIYKEEMSNSLNNSFDLEKEKDESDYDNSSPIKTFIESNLKRNENCQNGAPKNKMLINNGKDEYDQLKDFILNKNKSSKKNKEIGTYDSFKKNKKFKYLNENDGNYNNKFNYLNKNVGHRINLNNNYIKNYNPTEINDVEYDYQNKKNEIKEISINNTYIDENQNNINSILKGNVFEMLDINYNELILDNNDIKKEIELLKKKYEFKKDALEKTMDYYKSFLEDYYIQKLDDIKNNENDELKKDFIISDFKSKYENLFAQLNILYKIKKEELEYNYQVFINKFYQRK